MDGVIVQYQGVRDIVCGWYGPRRMPRCSSCGRPATKRHGRDGAGRQRFMCRPCHRTFTATSMAAFSTTKCVERSHSATRDRLRSSRGLKTPATGQRCFAGFDAVQALGRGHSCMEHLVPGYRSAGATGHAPGPGAGGGRGHHHVRVTAPPGSLTTASGPSHKRVVALELPQRLSEPLARC